MFWAFKTLQHLFLVLLPLQSFSSCFFSTCWFLLNCFNLPASHYSSTTNQVSMRCLFSGGTSTAHLFSADIFCSTPPPQGKNNPGNKRRSRKGTGWLHLWPHGERLIWLAGPAATDTTQRAPSSQASVELLHKVLLGSCYRVNRIIGMSRGSEALGSLTWTHLTFWPHRLSHTGVQLLSPLAHVFNCHTFRLTSPNAHLPLWTSPSSKHRANPISSSDCDARTRAVRHSHCCASSGNSQSPSECFQAAEPGHPQKREHWVHIHQSCTEALPGQVIWLFTCFWSLHSVTLGFLSDRHRQLTPANSSTSVPQIFWLFNNKRYVQGSEVFIHLDNFVDE